MAPRGGEDDGILDQKRQDGRSPASSSQPPITARERSALTDQKRPDGSYPSAQEASSSSTSALAPTASGAGLDTTERIPSYDEAISPASGGGGAVPTIDSPFNFPSANEPLPAYSRYVQSGVAGPSGGQHLRQKPIAIPQLAPDATAPFLSAYPPCLLARGVTEQTWRSFLETLSAFLTAKVSDRAIAHAGDVAKSMGEPPKQYGQQLVNHTKSVGKSIAKEAKRYNVIGVVANAIGGAVSIPLHATFGALNTIFVIPRAAMATASQTPKTPLQRAATYAAVASKDWLNARGYQAVLLTTGELGDMMHVPSDRLLEMAAEGKTGNATVTMRALNGLIEAVLAPEDEVVILGKKTLWLVLVPLVDEGEGAK